MHSVLTFTPASLTPSFGGNVVLFPAGVRPRPADACFGAMFAYLTAVGLRASGLDARLEGVTYVGPEAKLRALGGAITGGVVERWTGDVGPALAEMLGWRNGTLEAGTGAWASRDEDGLFGEGFTVLRGAAARPYLPLTGLGPHFTPPAGSERWRLTRHRSGWSVRAPRPEELVFEDERAWPEELVLSVGEPFTPLLGRRRRERSVAP